MAGMDVGRTDCPWCVCDLAQHGWEGDALGMLGFNVIGGAVTGYLIDRAIRRYRRR